MRLSLALVLTLFTSTATAGFFDKIPSTSGNYCVDEALEFLQRKFEIPADQIRIKFLSLGTKAFAIYAWTPLCGSEFRFESTLTAPHDCNVAQYGSRTYFLKRVYTVGDCLKYLPEDEILTNPADHIRLD